jgi:alkanesulfonate monooxygenase SsuD/methylene tetrahydromethanopterin reductase-like flavin-dependent oxidoreductase (luciferase family)/predicted kinase
MAAHVYDSPAPPAEAQATRAGRASATLLSVAADFAGGAGDFAGGAGDFAGGAGDFAGGAGPAPRIPDPALVVLIGASGAGKSAWAAAHYRPVEVVSSDQLRAVVGSGERDLDASVDAFALLDQIAAARTRRGLATVIDTLGLDPVRREGYLALARRARLPAVAVLVDTEAAVCRERNRGRSVPIPAAVLDAQLRRMRDVPAEVASEGWDLVLRARPARIEPVHSAEPADAEPADDQPATDQAANDQPAGAWRQEPGGLGFILQVSRFGWGTDPAGWLRSVALAAAEAGFEGIALMDHLIQIPQVGRSWEPIPEPWVTLGMLAGLGTGLRLGTLVSPVTFRPAGVLAKAVATLDALTGGRAFCGVGAGWWEREHAAFGLRFPPAGERLDQLELTIETMRALWRPGTKDYQGERVTLPETTCYPRPTGDVPVIVGGSGERRTLRIAARLGDGCNLPADLQTLDRKLAVLATHCAQVGRDPADLLVTVLDIPVVGTDRAHAAGLVERLRGRTAAATFAQRHHAGTPDDHIARYRLLAERGVATVFVALPDLAGPDEVRRLAPITAAFR